MSVSTSTKALLNYHLTRSIGAQSMRKLLQIPGATSLTPEAIGQMIPQIGKAIAMPGAWDEAQEAAEQQTIESRHHGVRILSPLDDEYPRLLANTADYPPLIWVKGTLTNTPEKSIAIIGTREPTEHGAVTTTRITQHFVQHGWSIVSGLALGCDSIAHQAALDAQGHTVAVMAHGLHTVAPRKHQKLADQILHQGGALVSQFPMGQDPTPQLFVIRDKTQAGLAQGVVMIQSDIKGGSLHASRAALEYDRTLIVPYPTPKDAGNKEPKTGANLLIADGSLQERLELLKCSDARLDKVFILKGKSDYPALISVLEGQTPTSADDQQSLLI